MRVAVNGTHLWFDVDGMGLVPGSPEMQPRPTVILLHGGPGSFDHSYLKPDFGRLTSVAQVVYLDLRDHGRSDWGDPEEWSLELCADDIPTFCDTLGIERPVVLGHSLGGVVAIVYGARHPDHPAGLVLQSTFARFDMDAVVEAFGRFGGHEVAAIARRSYGGDNTVTAEEWQRCWETFGPSIPEPDEIGRIKRNNDFNSVWLDRLQDIDVSDHLPLIECPTLISVGELDPVHPVVAAEEMRDRLNEGTATVDVIPDAGAFPWRDSPDHYFHSVSKFVTSVAPWP